MTPQQHARCLAEVDRLMAEQVLAPNPQGLELIDFLATLIAKYEDETIPIPVAQPILVLRHLMEARELSQQGLAHAVGVSPSHLSSILSGETQITVEQAQDFAHVFNVSPRLFVVA